jgi:hypothetical protein
MPALGIRCSAIVAAPLLAAAAAGRGSETKANTAVGKYARYCKQAIVA